MDAALAAANGLLAHDEGELDAEGIMKASAYMHLALGAMYGGDARLWNFAYQGLTSLPTYTEAEEERNAFFLTAVDLLLLNANSLPAWFKNGSFAGLPLDSYPFARVNFGLYQQALCYQMMQEGGKTPYSQDNFHKMITVCELLLSQTAAEGVILAEIYLRLSCAMGYHNTGQNEAAAEHIDRAIALALPDKLYAPLVERHSTLDFLLAERLAAVDKTTLRQFRAVERQFITGWKSLYNTLYNKSVFNGFTIREQEVVKLAAIGLTNQQIAAQLHISLRSVMQALQLAIGKTGAKKRSELSKYI